MRLLTILFLLHYLVGCLYALNICDSEWSRRTQEIRQGGLNFYLSPCSQKDNLKSQNLCDPDYAACITKVGEDSEESPFIRDLGVPMRNTIEEGYGLHFKGPACSKDAEFTTVIIRFICDYGLYEDKVSILQTSDMQQSSCIFIFLWLSPSACPRNTVTSLQSFEACELNVKEIQHTVNLNNMIRTNESFVLSSTSDRKYRLRLCSGVPADEVCGGSVLCLTGADGSVISDLGFGTERPMNWTVTASYDYWMTNVTLVYESYEALIHFNFLCTKDTPYIQFGSEHTTTDNKQFVTFNVFTKQACPINVTECPLLSNSIDYDLRNLILKDWTLGNLSITLCRPNQNCPHEDEAICSEDGEVSAFIQDGHLHRESNGILSDEQQIRLTYNTTQQCSKGGNGSITFIFECDNDNLGPALLDTQGGCHFYALWRTPFVCFRLLGDELDVFVHRGVNKCLFGDLGIDLSPLFNKEGDVIVYDSVSNASWAVNICGGGLWGGASGTCGKNSAVCKLDTVPSLQDRIFPSKKSLNGTNIAENSLIHGIQMGPMINLVYSSGRKCESDEKKNQSTLFTFVCGARQTVSKPEYIMGNNSCQEKFLWSTHLVCPAQSISCEIEGPPGTTIDLGILSGSNINDDIIVHEGDSVFILDICRELEGSKMLYDCPSNSAACVIVTENGTEVSLGLGELRNPPTYNSTTKEVYLDYTMGSLCSGGSHHHTHYSTRIIFRCDWGRKFFVIEFIGLFGCQYQFLVVSDAACPRKKDLINSEGCFITGNPDFPNEIIDFSQMVDEDSFLSYKDNLGTSFHINICESLPGQDSYAAMMKDPSGKEVMLGRKSEAVRVVDKIIYIEYTDGDTCADDPSLKYSIIIRFVCPRFDSPVYLQLIEKGRCIYIFNIYTSFVCVHRRGRCGVSTYEGHHYDFSPLMKPSDSSYVVDESWHLNICQSVESCGVVGNESHPVSVCKGPEASSKVMSRRFLINEKLQLIYETGESCPSNANKTLSSVISFSCDPHRYPGYPKKQMDNDSCQIGFDFPTALACKNLSLPYIYTSRSCKFHHSGLGRFLDFSPLKTRVLKDGWTLSPCQNASCTACANGSSYGHVHSSQYDFQHESLIINNRGGSLCNEGSNRRSSKIWFKCDRALDNGDNRVRVIYQSPCFAEFEWSTSLVCVPYNLDESDYVTMAPPPTRRFEGMVIIPFVLIILIAIGAVTYLKRKYGRRFLQIYRRRGFSSFVSYRRDFASGDETLDSMASSLHDENSEQYKMF